MNISNQIIEVLDAMCQKIGIAINWTDQNIMPCLTDFLSRFVKFEITKSIVNICIPIVLLVISGICFKVFCLKKDIDWDTYDITGEQVLAVISGIVFGIIVIINIVVIPTEVTHIAKTAFVPEAIIIELIKQYI